MCSNLTGISMVDSSPLCYDFLYFQVAMQSLTFAQIGLIRHRLQTACRLLEPGSAAREAFRTGLVSLLLQTGRMKTQEEARNYLAGILGPTCLAYGGEAPRQNSSPVCYAHVPGLRPEFEEPVISEQLDSPAPAKNARFPGGRLQEHATLQEELLATQNSVRQILTGGQSTYTGDAVLDNQIADLVNQLFGMT